MSAAPDLQTSQDEEEDEVKAKRVELAEVRSELPKKATKFFKTSLDCDMKMVTTFAVEEADNSSLTAALKSFDDKVERMRMNVREEVRLDKMFKEFEELDNRSNNLSKGLTMIRDLSSQSTESQ